MKELVKRTLRAAAALFTALSLAVTSFAVPDTPDAVTADDAPVTVLEPVAEDRLPTGDLVIPEPVEVPWEVSEKYLYVPEPGAPVTDGGSSSYNTSSSYYYSTMNDAEKQLYDSFKTMFEEFYNGSADPNSGKDSGGNTIYFLEYVNYKALGISDDRAINIAHAFYWSEPKYFFIFGSYSCSGKSVNGVVTEKSIALLISPEFTTRNKIDRYKSVIESLTDEWMSEINAVSGDAEREELIFKKICDRTMYHYNKQGQAVSEYNNQTIAGALVDQECVCNGYAMTMTYFANAAGLDCMLVVSAGHAWNIIKIDGVWYELDVTWTDQDRGCPNSANLIYDWVNKSHSTFTYNKPSHEYDGSKITTGSSSTLLVVPNCTNNRVDTVPTHTVTYVCKGYMPVTEKVRDGNNPPYLNFTNLVVTGYYSDADCTVEYDMNTIVNEDKTIYFTSGEQTNIINVYFDTKCGIPVSSQRVLKGEKVTQPSVTRPGFELEGWYTNKECSSAYNFSSTVSTGMTLFARWTKTEVKCYTVKFDSQGGSKVADATVEDGKTVSEPTAPTRDGYNFEGWYTDTDFKTKYVFSTPVKSNLTLYAKWTEKPVTKYTVKFDTNGGSDVDDATVEDGKTVAKPTDPTKDGFDFDGWYKDNTTFKNKYDFSSPVKSNLTLYAKWTEKPVTKYTVKFDTNGGSDVDDATVEDGKTVAKPTDPTKEGFDFEGWYTDNTTFKTKYDFSTAVKSNFTLYAKWKEKTKFTVKFDSQGGSKVADATVVDGKTVAEPEAPTKEGFNFEGWYTETDFKTKYDFSTPVKSNFTLYANWTKNKVFTVKFDTNGGSEVADATVEDGKTVAKPTDPTKDGFDFDGWYTDNTAFKTKYDFSAAVKSNFTLYAKWKEKTKFTVKFDSQGGSKVADATVVDGKTVAEPEAPTKEGFNFEGWYTETDFKTKYDFSTPVKSNFTLYANWTKNKVFTVKFDTNGGSEVADATVEDGKTVAKPTDPTKEGFDFEGWYTDNTTFKTKYDFSTAVKSNFTLYAKWKEKTKFTVKFDSQGGSNVADATVVDGKTVAEPEAPTKEGFNFEGWYTETDFKTKYDFSTPVKSNFTLYANWTKNKVFTVKFDTNGGSEVADATVEEGKTVAKPTDPTKEGFDFDGWYTDNTTFKTKYDFSAAVKSNFTLYAKWKEKTKFTVKFDSQGGSKVADATVVDGKTVAEPEEPTMEGYKFGGWYKESTCATKYDFSAPVRSNFTLYAKWIKSDAETFTVIFDSAGGSAVAKQTVEKGATAAEPEDPTRDGYSFLGWYLGETLFRFRTPITADITLTAKWAAKKYSVVFDSAGGTPVEMQRVEYGKTLTVPTVSKSGFELDCWMYNGKPFDFSTPVTSDMTLTAKWTANKYTVRFIFNGEEYGTQSVPHGERVIFPQITPAAGNMIVGWCTDAAMSSLFLAETPVTLALTLYAKEVTASAKIIENGEVVTNDLNKAVETATGDSKVITLNEDDTVKSLKFPKNSTEIAIDGGGNTLGFTGSVTLKPEQKLAVTDMTLVAEKNGKKQNITINGAAAGLTLENVAFDGKKVSVTTNKGDLVLNDVKAPNSTIKGNAKTNLSVGGETDADTISGYGKIIVDGILTIRKSLVVYDLVLADGAVLNIGSGASVTIRSSISGSGIVHLADGFKPITLNGYASGRIYLTSDDPLDDKQIFKSSAAALGSVFDVSGAVSDPAYELIAKSGKVYLRRVVVRVGDRSYSEWADAMSDITKLNAKGEEYTVELLGDITVNGALKLPSKGKYAGLVIIGNGHSITFGGTSLSLTGSLTLKNVTVSAVKSGRPVKWTLKTNKFAFEQGNAVLENCTVK